MQPDRDHARGARQAAPVGGLLFAMVFPTLATWLYFVWAGPAGAAWVYSVCKIAQFAWPLLWMSRASWRSLWPARLLSRESVIGVGFGLLAVTSSALAVLVLGERGGILAGVGAQIARKLEAFGIVSPVEFLALATFYSVLHSYLEEYYWRWFVHAELRRRMARTASTVISSLSFTSHHVILLVVYFWPAWPLVVAFSLATAAGGAVWAWLYDEGAALTPPWLSHLVVDAGLMSLGYLLVFGGLGT